MKTIQYNIFVLLAFFILTGLSCKKSSSGPHMVVYGYVKSKTDGALMSNTTVTIYVYKNGKGMGIITGHRSDYGGQGKTNNLGYFEVKVKLFKDASGLEVSLTDANGNFGYYGGQLQRFKIINFERQEIELVF